MKKKRPTIGITMGDPTGIGPEIILLSLSRSSIYKICNPVVFGDINILETAKKYTKSNLDLSVVTSPDSGRYECGSIDVINLSDLNPETTWPGKPNEETGRAMIDYITNAIDSALNNTIAAIVTCPINKTALKMAGCMFSGHTELLASKTKCNDFAMMLTGGKLRVTLVTIHMPLKDVPSVLSIEKILKTIRITGESLSKRFGIVNPCIAVAGFNPHAGEAGMFGEEEKKIIAPAIRIAKKEGFNVSGPHPPDTVFYHASKGRYHAVVCMYHDQGLIPFKMMHFTDGVNTTLGLPILRTSVDHGTAYDIAGTGQADPGSLIEAIKLAAIHSKHMLKNY
jgi:4-hydroxythreonine-4-phosphate dehydrogenase